MPFFGFFTPIRLPFTSNSTFSARAQTSISAGLPSLPGQLQLRRARVSCQPLSRSFFVSYTGYTASRGPGSSP